jgi:putative glutathione S-transferase
VSCVHPFRDSRGWAFDGARYADALNGFDFLSEAYARTDPDFSDRVSVPVLWDKQEELIVNNESADIMRMLNDAFDAWAHSDVDLRPAPLCGEIDDLNAWIYTDINNAVYRAGFAATPSAYEDAFDRLFAGLARAEDLLSNRRYLTGDTITEADWRLWVTLLRFDRVYHTHFRCNGARIVDFPNLWDYTRGLHQQPGIAETISWPDILEHYYTTHDELNPKRIIAKGPIDLDFDAPSTRGPGA